MEDDLQDNHEALSSKEPQLLEKEGQSRALDTYSPGTAGGELCSSGRSAEPSPPVSRACGLGHAQRRSPGQRRALCNGWSPSEEAEIGCRGPADSTWEDTHRHPGGDSCAPPEAASRILGVHGVSKFPCSSSSSRRKAGTDVTSEPPGGVVGRQIRGDSQS